MVETNKANGPMTTEETPLPEQKEKSWVWYSTVESAAAKKISVLAVVELLLMTVIGFWLYFQFGLTWHLLFGLVIAPLFYLCTEESTQWALEWANRGHYFLFAQNSRAYKTHPWEFLGALLVIIASAFYLIYFPLLAVGIESSLAAIIAAIVVGMGAGTTAIVIWSPATHPLPNEFRNLATESLKLTAWILGAIIFLLGVPGWSIFYAVLVMWVRLGAVSWVLVRSPSAPVLAIPDNWRRHHFMLDSRHPPEVLPGAELCETSVFRFSLALKEFPRRLDDAIMSGISMILVYIPAIIFRYTMKMSAWLWLPFVWLLQAPKSAPANANAFLNSESTEFWANFRLLYSFIVLGLFTLLPLVLASRLQDAGWTEHALALVFLFGFAKLWTWTRAGAALLSIFSYFTCRLIRLHRDNGVPDYGDFWIPKLKHLAYLRNGLSLFTLAATLWIVATQLIDWEVILPALQNMKLLPG